MVSLTYIKPNLFLRILLALCLLLCTTQEGYAQRYPFFNLSVENGLIQSQATCATQDHYGNLWIGTIGGLSRYDGKSFTNYSIRNGLPNNMVQSLATDKKGNLWIASQGVMSEFDGKNFRQYHFQSIEGSGGNLVHNIHVSDSNIVWCLAGAKVYSIVNGKTKQLQLPGNAAGSTLLPDKNDLLIGTPHGVLYTYHNNKWDSLTIPNTPVFANAPFISNIFKDKEGRIWLTTNEGLYKVDSGHIVVHHVNNLALYMLPFIYAMTEDNSGAYWLATNNGVIRMTNNSLQYYNKHNGLTDNMVYDIIDDAEGNIWMATDGQGIFRFSGTQFTGLDESMGLQTSQVSALTKDRNGRLFLGTYNGGLYSFQDGAVSPIAFPSNPIPAVISLCTTHDGKLWIGTRGKGLWRYDNTFRQYVAPDRHFPSDVISALHTDTSHNLYIGFNNGAMVYEHDSFKTIPDIHTVVEDFITIGKDSVLLATESGIKLYNAQSTAPFRTNSIADSAYAQCFTLRGRELWIGTSDNGVICYNLDTHHAFVLNKSNGLQSDFIYSIIADNDGNIWLGTGYGIHKISRGDNGQPSVTFYGKGQGITGMESNHNAVVKMQDGGIWFGTTNGALHYQPHAKVNSSQPISIVLQSVKIFGEAITDTTYYDSTDKWYGIPYNLHLPYKKNNITFSFQAITLTGGQQLLYRYRIDGLDAPWSDWSATNSVTYSALPPGKYTFRVACMSASSGQPIQELTYSFEIITPFQKTRWFRLAIFGACILLGITMQYIVNKRKERRRNLLARLRAEEQAKIRMRTAEDFHDEVGNKLTRINVLTNVLRSKISPVTPDTKRILDQIEDNTGQLYSGTRDILWSLTPTNDNLYEILHRIRDFGTELFQDTEVEFVFTGTDEKWRNYRLPLDVSRNLIMIFKEALNNTLKYSKATKVKLDITLKRHDVLQLLLTDNGAGFDVRNVKKGHGINNMNVRATRINGRLYIDSREHKGTITNLTFKIPPKR